MFKPECRESGRGWFDLPSSSSWWRLLSTWGTRAFPTTSTTGVTSWWDCCRERSSRCSRWVDLCPLVCKVRANHVTFQKYSYPINLLAFCHITTSSPLPESSSNNFWFESCCKRRHWVADRGTRRGEGLGGVKTYSLFQLCYGGAAVIRLVHSCRMADVGNNGWASSNSPLKFKCCVHF